MSFYRNAAGLLLTSAAAALIGFATSVLLARFLTPEDRGAYALAVSFTVLAASLARLGWPAASVYRLRAMRSHPGEVVATGIAFVAALSVVSVLAGTLLEPWLAEQIFVGAPDIVVRLAIAAVPALILGRLMESIARGIDRFSIGNWYRVLVLVLILCAVVMLLVVREGGVVQVVVAYLVIQSLCAVGLTLAIIRHTRLSLSLHRPELATSTRFALKNYATALSSKLHQRLDVFLIAYFTDPAELAFYVIAVSIVERMKLLTEALAQAAYPQLAGLDEERAAEFACDVVRQSILWVLSAALPIALAAPLFVPLVYGAPYSASVLPLLVLLPGLVGLTVYRVLFRYFMAIDRQGVNVVAQNVALVANIVLNLVLIPSYGINGAAVSSSVTYILVAGLVSVAFIRRSGRGPVQLLVPTPADLDAYVSRAGRVLRRVLGGPAPALDED